MAPNFTKDSGICPEFQALQDPATWHDALKQEAWFPVKSGRFLRCPTAMD